MLAGLVYLLHAKLVTKMKKGLIIVHEVCSKSLHIPLLLLRRTRTERSRVLRRGSGVASPSLSCMRIDDMQLRSVSLIPIFFLPTVDLMHLRSGGLTECSTSLCYLLIGDFALLPADTVWIWVLTISTKLLDTEGLHGGHIRKLACPVSSTHQLSSLYHAQVMAASCFAPRLPPRYIVQARQAFRQTFCCPQV